jgi:hypothetical protein
MIIIIMNKKLVLKDSAAKLGKVSKNVFFLGYIIL